MTRLLRLLVHAITDLISSVILSCSISYRHQAKQGLGKERKQINPINNMNLYIRPLPLGTGRNKNPTIYLHKWCDTLLSAARCRAESPLTQTDCGKVLPICQDRVMTPVLCIGCCIRQATRLIGSAVCGDYKGVMLITIKALTVSSQTTDTERASSLSVRAESFIFCQISS